MLGFSFTGSSIPWPVEDGTGSCGTLTDLALTGEATGIAYACSSPGAADCIVFSTPAGVAFDVGYYGAGGGGGVSCDADEDGICDDIDDCVGSLDCAGVCNGSSVEDCNGDCDG